jgi:ABC-2 type transport system permease protein
VVRRIVSSSLQPENWKMEDTTALLITLGYTAVFATLGIKWFKWSNK